MMGKIAILPDELCNRIAAGEVVERPAAVVKELVENSLDAGATRVSARLLQGGRREIRVSDNGCGMSPDDALMALERHGTSKIKKFEDLEEVATLGFRGEALPSIAAVSRFRLVTREPEAVAGTRLEVEGGIIRNVVETGAPAGTTITVRDLFFNTPARRKFLRTVETEISHAADSFLRMALAHPLVHLELHHQERSVYDFPAAPDLARRAEQVLKIRSGQPLQPISLETPDLAIRGLAGPPELQRKNTRWLFTFINGRPVWDRPINQAVIGAYDTLLPKGAYPVVVLFVELPPRQVDVNVHPTKREIRLREPRRVLDAVRDAVRRSLGDLQRRGWQRPLAGTAEPPGAAGADPSFREPAPYPESPRQVPARPEPPVDVSLASGFEARENQAGFEAAPAQPAAPGEASPEEAESRESLQPVQPAEVSGFAALPVLGQVANAYVLLEAPDGLVIVDQHAAHERILFDRLDRNASPTPSQRLALPQILELLPGEAEALRGRIEILQQAGFEIEPFGGDTFAVRAVPALLAHAPAESLIRSVLELNGARSSEVRSALLAALTKTAACHSAVRSGRRLHPEEIRSLLRDLDRTGAPATCPHGRPLWWKLTLEDFARVFGRHQ
jgi:DNA mismatch repair protein MutL